MEVRGDTTAAAAQQWLAHHLECGSGDTEHSFKCEAKEKEYPREREEARRHLDAANERSGPCGKSGRGEQSVDPQGVCKCYHKTTESDLNNPLVGFTRTGRRPKP